MPIQNLLHCSKYYTVQLMRLLCIVGCRNFTYEYYKHQNEIKALCLFSFLMNVCDNIAN
jgi:hypothetical protein